MEIAKEAVYNLSTAGDKISEFCCIVKVDAIKGVEYFSRGPAEGRCSKDINEFRLKDR